jgi:hypothetical protein
VSWAFQLAAAALAFTTYLSMYGFRKPFTAGVYAGDGFFGLDLKTVFVLSQLLGYTCSKYLGVKLVSEAQRRQRLVLLLGLVAASEIALIAFGLAPRALKPAFLFCNGLPLGMVWGLVVRYLEGRRSSDLLLAFLSCSFIVGSGVVKDVARWLLRAGVSEEWMPALTGLAFLVPFVVSAALLDRCPEPDAEDVRRREVRLPMGAKERRAFLTRHLPGVVLLALVYLLLTAYRDFRDNYAVEMFSELGYGETPALFTQTELPVALLVLVSLASLVWVQERVRGVVVVFGVMVSGLLLVAASTLLLDRGLVSGAVWMVGVGLGTYLAYVPFSSFLFDRLMAATRFAGTAVFLVNLLDAVGYTGSVGLQLWKDLGAAEMTRLSFFRNVSYGLGSGGALLLALAGVYFVRQAVRSAEPAA